MFDLILKRAFAFGLPPETIDVAAVPALRVPVVGFAVIVETNLQPLNDDGRRSHAAILGHQLLAGPRHERRIEVEIGCVGLTISWIDLRRLRRGRRLVSGVRIRCGCLNFMRRMILRSSRHGGGENQWRDECGDHLHDATPSRGRMVTTLNMPECMCISMWQWNAQSPGASAVRSKDKRPPGATFTVCFKG